MGTGKGVNVALEKELETFERELHRLLQVEGNRGKYALIHGDTVAGVWPTQEEALEQGYARFNVDPFLVKPIVEHETPQYFSRSVKPCRS
jgi:hypothetical protein